MTDSLFLDRIASIIDWQETGLNRRCPTPVSLVHIGVVDRRHALWTIDNYNQQEPAHLFGDGSFCLPALVSETGLARFLYSKLQTNS